jgi:hypothetical protein
VGTLVAELLAHEVTSLVQDVFVPGTGGRDTSGEDADVVRNTVRKRTVLKTKSIETKTLDRLDVAYARSRLTRNHDCLFLEGQLSNKCLCTCSCVFPAADTGSIGCGIVSDTIEINVSKQDDLREGMTGGEWP